MKLYIRNMVCARCKMVVARELEALGLHTLYVELGEVEVDKVLSTEEKQQINDRLRAFGFELIDDKRSRIIEQIKTKVVELVHQKDGELSSNLSTLLSASLHYDYPYLSNLFSAVEGTTIEKYFIAQKIERVKELLIYDELTLSEIAFRLNYSSVAHLSSQFKKVTGMTPSRFKLVRGEKRIPLDEV